MPDWIDRLINLCIYLNVRQIRKYFGGSLVLKKRQYDAFIVPCETLELSLNGANRKLTQFVPLWLYSKSCL